jgi:SET domain-containing protein
MPSTKTPRKPKTKTTAAVRPSAGAPVTHLASADTDTLPPCDNEWFELRGSLIQGLGAFAKKDIPRGTRLIEYIGEKISYAESDKRYPDTRDERHHTFLFTLNSKWIIDAAFGGNESRFINHSCEPNCDAYIERGHIWIESIKRIPAGTELAYDYQYEYLDEYTEEDLKFYSCRCGSAKCRGTIVAPKKKKKKA